MSWLYWLRFLFVAALVITVVLIAVMNWTGGPQVKSPRGENKDL